jgi:hypothetical protein
MQKSGRLVLTVVALIATVLALYVQIFELRSRQAEDRLEAARLDSALAASRARLKSEILAELRAELAEQGSKAPRGTQPLPNTVLRRLESGALRQSADPLHPEESLTLPQLNASLSSLAQQVEESERSVRRDLEELRAATLRQAEVSFRVTGLILVALIPLLVQLLLSGLPPRRD